MRTFEYSDARSHKFWNIDLHGDAFTVTYGRIGSAGQAQTKTFADETRARKEHDKLVTEKLKKGYRETTASAAAGPASLRESLEAALVDNPDDLASHMAYADYLAEQGDPHGEFVRVQLQLEDESRSAEERKKLQQREKRWLKAHARTWLGDLAPYLLDQKPEKQSEWSDLRVDFTFRRGWLDSLRTQRYKVEFARALARSPQLRLLRKLELVDQQYEDPTEIVPGDDVPEGCNYPQLYPLVRCPYLGNVRTFILGAMMTPEEESEADDGGFSCHTEGEAAVGMIKQMPRLEELYLLAHEIDAEQLFSLRTLDRLRVLLLYHGHRYPLARLAKNPALGNLTHLLCHPHAMDDEEPYIREPGLKAVVNSPALRSLTHLRLRLSDLGDKGARTIVESGILKRLKLLDLQHGCITDEGARTLAACPDLKNLELLDLTDNCLTDQGLAALQASGVKVAADNQWQAMGEAWESREYLYAGDIE